MIRSVTRGLAALVALGVLLVGVPAALWTLGRPWLPDHLPTVDEITATLSRPDDGSLFLGTLVVVGAVAWACFAFGVLIELPTQLGLLRRPVRLPAGMRWSQHLAGGLLAAVLSMTLAPAVGAATAAPAHADPPAPVSVSAEADPPATAATPAAPVAPRPAAAPAVPRYTVGHHDTLWLIAEQTLGDGLRYPEIAALNRGVVQADGGALADGDVIREGWVLMLPADARTGPAAAAERPAARVVVERGDTLSEIAAEEGLAGWRPVYEANVGRPQRGGATLTDPDLIMPGWVLTVPGTAVAVPAEPAPAPAPEPIPVPPAPPVTEGGGDVLQDLPITPPSPAASSEGRAGGETAPPAAAGVRANGDALTQDTPARLATTLAGGGALLAAGMGAGLAVARRRRAHRRRAGRAVAATPARLVAIEATVDAAARAGEADFAALDVVLRGLSLALSRCPEGRLPDVVAARLANGRLGLRLHTPAAAGPPEPWVAQDAGLWWEVELSAATAAVDPALAGSQLAPYPGLVSVGVDDAGRRWMLDLERIGALQLTGPDRRCEDFARHLVAELAVNSWSDLMYVTTVGFGAELGELNRQRLAHRDGTGQIAGELGNKLRDTAEVAAAQEMDVLDGRLRSVAGDAWMPEVLVVAPHTGAHGDELAALTAAVAEGGVRAAVAVVVTAAADEPDVGWRAVLGEDGQLSVPALDLRLQAAQLTAEQGADIAALFAFEHHAEDVTIPAAAGDAVWQVSSDAAGALLPALTVPRASGSASEATVGRRPGRSPWTPPVPDSVLPQATDVYVAASATTAEELDTLAPRAPVELAGSIESDLQGLDRDLADWWDPDTSRPRLSVLGPVVVRGLGSEQAVDRAGLRGRCEEVIAYLAANERGAGGEELAAAVLQRRRHATDSADDAGKDPTDLRALVYTVTAAARKWLGQDADTGQAHLSTAHRGRPYTLRGLLVDAELFRQLRCRAAVRGTAGLRDLQAALELVTGPPFDQRVAGYGWLDGLDAIYTAMVCDVAHLVVTATLAGGDLEAARSANAVALGVAAEQEKVLLDAALVAFADGAEAEAEAHIARMVQLADGQDELDLWPDTAAALHRARTQSQQRRAS